MTPSVTFPPESLSPRLRVVTTGQAPPRTVVAMVGEVDPTTAPVRADGLLRVVTDPRPFVRRVLDLAGLPHVDTAPSDALSERRRSA
jgi:hypothetical protein